MLSEITAWLLSLVKTIFTTLWTFVVDAFVHILDLVLGAVVALLSSIPVPSFLAQGLQSVFSQLDPGIAFFVTAIGIPQVLGMFGAAYLFRLIRKAVTLFQW